jgi:hypothetical protein
MDFRVSNVETDEVLKQRAREYIIQRVCDKYRLEGDLEFTPEEMEKALQAYDKKFLRFNIRDVLNGWDLIEFTEEGFSLRLNQSGKKHCREQDKGPKPHFLYLSNGHPNLVLSFAIKRAALVGRVSTGH